METKERYVSVRRLEDRLGEVAASLLETLADPRDEVTYDVRLGSMPIEIEHEGEPVEVEAPAVCLYVALRPCGAGAALIGQAAMPLAAASSSELFSHGLEMLWDQLEFKRIALRMPELEVRGQAIIDAQPD